MREVQTGPVSSENLHFGLGDARRVDVVVRWPSGLVQGLRDVRADRELVIVEPVECIPGQGSRVRDRRRCRDVRYAAPDETPVPIEVPPWAEPLLPEEGPLCQAFVNGLVVQREICHELARECERRAAALPGPVETNLECALPDLAAFGCGDSPEAELLSVCDCFPYPEEEEPS